MYGALSVACSGAGGFIAVEWVAAVALLLLPTVVLVATMPGWAERRNGATVAAREAARDLVGSWPDGDPVAAELVAREVAADHGIDAADLDVRVVAVGRERGDEVEVEVEVSDAGHRSSRYVSRGVALHRPGDPPRRRLPEPVMRHPGSTDQRGTIMLWVLGLCRSR